MGPARSCRTRACAPAARHAYPHELSTGAHGFRIDSLSGSIALAGLDGADLEFVVNLGQLKARTIELGDHGIGRPGGAGVPVLTLNARNG